MIKNQEINLKLNQLISLDPTFQIFGSRTHKYKLNPTINSELIREIELQYSIFIPNDYIEFITTIGDGGAGIDYGLNNFLSAVENGKLEKPFLGVNELLKITFNKNWNSDRNTLIDNHKVALYSAFKTSNLSSIETTDLFKMAENLGLDLDEGQNYLIYSELKNHDLSNINFEEIYIEVDKDLINGYIELFRHGCGHVSALIVKGESWGEIIQIGNDGQLKKTNLTFSDYYLDWLNKSLIQSK